MKKISAINYVCRKCGALEIEEGFCGCDNKLYCDSVSLSAREFLSGYFGGLEIDVLPELKYKGIKNVDYQPDNSIYGGEVKIEAIFKSPSGIKIRSDIPLLIKSGSFLSPSVIFFGDNPHIVSASVINGKIRAGTFPVERLEREMLDPPLDPEAREVFNELPKKEKEWVPERNTIFDIPN